MADYRTNQQAAGRSPGTIRLHRYWLNVLAGRVASPDDVTTDDMAAVMSGVGWAPETRKSIRTTYRAFFLWAYESGRLPADPAARLPRVSVPQALPRPAPENVVEHGLGGGERVRLMVMLAAYAGLRASEIGRVHSSHLVGDQLLIKGKGGKVREVPIMHPELLARLRAVDGWAFPNGHGSHLTPGHVTKLVSRALPEGWTCHTLRHRMATAAYAGTHDLLAVGALLGHSRPETTQRYVRMPDGALRAAVGAAQPLSA